jgi:hypothetical protein
MNHRNAEEKGKTRMASRAYNSSMAYTSRSFNFSNGQDQDAAGN